MELFAHNGVDHATASEAAAHSTTSIVITTLLITAAVALIAGSAVYLVNRFALKKVQIKDREEN